MAPTIKSKVKEWLLGGGILLLISGSVAYGLNKQSVSDKFIAHEEVDNNTSKRVDELEAGRVKNADAITSIKIDLAEIKNDVKWIRSNLGCEDISVGNRTATKKP